MQGAGQHSTALATSRDLGNSRLVLGMGDFEKSLPHSGSILGCLPGWPCGSEGLCQQPKSRGPLSSAQQSVFEFAIDHHDGSSSSGSHASPQVQIQSQPAAAASTRIPAQPCTSSNGIKTRQRSRRLASKRAQHATQDSLENPAVTQTADEANQRNPEADHQFKQILGQVPSALGQAPFGCRPTNHLTIAEIQKELSLDHSLLVPRLSSSNDPVPCGASGPQVGNSLLTLDQALESMSPSKGFSLSLHNPFEDAAGNSSWEVPVRAEGREAQNGPGSDDSATCHQVRYCT